MPPDLFQALLDPTAPVPAWWPVGGWGAFLLFLFPLGGGIPVGVLMARDGGVGPLGTSILYFLSDVVLAFMTEPFLVLIQWVGRRVPALARLGHWLGRFAGSAGLRDEGPRGPLGLILVAFAISPTTGRAAAAAAGHGFVPGWAFAITGDMGYFVLLMGSTLWLSEVLGNDKLVVGLMLGISWVLPLLLRRLRKGTSDVAAAEPSRVEPASLGRGGSAAAVLPMQLATREPSPRQLRNRRRR